MRTNPIGRPSKIDKEDLLNAAQKLFAENGFFGTSTRDLSKAAGCNVAMISYHFGSKDGLYEAILLRHLQRVKSVYLSSANEGGASKDELKKSWPEFKDPVKRQFCAALFEFARIAVSNTEMQKIMCREMMTGAKKMVTILSKSETGISGVLQANLESLKARKMIRADVDLRLAAFSLISPIIYSCIAAPVLKEIGGLKSLDESYMRSLCIHLTRTFFDGWGTGKVS